MKRKIKSIVLLMCAGTSVAIATIAVNFTADPRFSAGNRLRINGSLVLDFSIDHSGQVSVDASVDKSNLIDVIDTVNQWDGIVGNVTTPSLFNSSFTFTANGLRRDNAGNLYMPQVINIDGAGTGCLGVNGQNSSAIDGASSPRKNHEMLVWMLSSSLVDFKVELKSFSWDARGTASGRSIMLFDNDTTDSWYGQKNVGSMNVSGYVIGNGEQITFTMPEDGNAGYGLSGFTLDVFLSPNVASLKPTMIGLITD